MCSVVTICVVKRVFGMFMPSKMSDVDYSLIELEDIPKAFKRYHIWRITNPKANT